MRVRVLGSTGVVGVDGPVPLTARKPRSILAALAMTPGATTTSDRLVDLVWGDDAPAGVHGTLHAYISGLRRVLEPDLAPRGRPTVLVTTDDGYRLDLDPLQVDAVTFAREVRARHSALAPLWSQLSTGPEPGWPGRDDVGTHVEALEQALRMWSGSAYADLGDHPSVLADRAALDELRATAEEDTALGLLALGEHAAVLAATEQSGGRHPLRERTRSLQALALVRTGRHVEALDVLRGYGELLADELGLDPGPEVRALEQAVLRQDPALMEWLRPAITVAPAQSSGRMHGPRSAPPHTPGGGWEMVGRDKERAAVDELLGAAEQGRSGAILVVGDPGTGKTRLVDAALAAAADHGVQTAVGRCSQDDGAPPLWPWFALLDGLGLERPAELDRTGAPDGTDLGPEHAFAVQDALSRAVRRRAAEGPVLLVVEDLHWADTRTLRALSHLVASTGAAESVALLVTRRARPQPTGALADLGATLARHGARTLELDGLDEQDARTLVAAVGGGVDTAVVDAWRARTGGNPFFLVELARLAATRGGPPADVPESVQAVVARRLDDLPQATREVLLVSAALGREHSPLLLAQVGGWTPDEVSELVEPAEEAGLLVERTDGRLAFEHALTRDAVLAATSPARVARTHSRIAHALESVGRGAIAPAERAFDLAHHWLAAGPVHAPRAWRAASAAALEARRDFANHEAADLYRAALDAHALDPDGTREERYELLLSFTEAAAWAGKWRPVVAAVVEAVALASADDDPERVARAAASYTRYSIWLPQEFGEVDEDFIDDLRGTLRQLDHHDSPVRCVLMLVLAVALYYRPGSRPEVEALVDEGLAVAHRIGEPALRGWAARSASLALWRSADLDRREALARDELAAARESGDEAAEAIAHLAVAGAGVERGDLAVWLEHSAAAQDIARRRRLAYAEFVLHFVRLNLANLAHDDAAADLHTEAMRTIGEQTATPAREWTEFGAVYIRTMWRPDTAGPVSQLMLDIFRENPSEFARTPLLHVLVLAGRLDDLRTELDRAPLSVPHDAWDFTSELAARILVAALIDDRGLARRSVEALRAASGRMVVSGISVVAGPVDGYLAAGLAVVGEHEEATGLAERAVVLAEEWGMTAYLEWLAGTRERLGF